MSIIKYCALGGLGEVGKNMSIIEVDDKIFILDVGIKFPSIKLYGIDTVIPDFEYLRDNKDRIQGIFLSHGHLEHSGAVSELLKSINVGVFGTHFTLSLVEQDLIEAGLEVGDYRLYRINEQKTLKFGDVQVCFFRTTHTIPESTGIAIKTNDGAIVYASDFTFRSVTDPIYRTSYDKISEICNDGVLFLCADSLGVFDIDRVTTDYVFNHTVSDVLSSSKRVIFSMYSTDLIRIQKVIDLCVQSNRRIALLGRKAQRNINVAMNVGYLKIPDENLTTLKFMDGSVTNDEDDLAIIIAGNRHEPYYMLHRMSTGQDKLISINESDTIVIVSPPVIGTEKIASKTIDSLHRINSNIVNVSKSMLVGSHADSEDLKMLYQMLNPQYIIPIGGEYRHQYVQREIAEEAGYEKDSIIMLDNGDQITFEDGVLQASVNKIPTGDVLIDGSLVGDINGIVIRDRELLAQGGTIVLLINIDINKKRILSRPKVVSKGFMSGTVADDVLEEISMLALNIVMDFCENDSTSDINELRKDLKDRITKDIIFDTHQNPIIIPVLIDASEEENEINEQTKR